jgi:hypothetical protein
VRPDGYIGAFVAAERLETLRDYLRGAGIAFGVTAHKRECAA